MQHGSLPGSWLFAFGAAPFPQQRRQAPNAPDFRLLIRTLPKLIHMLTKWRHRSKEVPFTERLSNRERQDIGLPPLPDPWVDIHFRPGTGRRNPGDDERM
jgi:hypothetical protein